MGFSTAVWVSTLVWGLNGWFQSFGAPGGVVAMTAWFSNRERGRCYGIWSTAHSIGEGLTFIGVGTIVALLGWRWGFWVPALAGIATAAMAYTLLQDRPRTLGLPTVADWRNDHYATAPRQRQQRLSHAAVDSENPRDLGARAVERDDLRHALRDQFAGASCICRKRAATRCSWRARCS